MQTHKVLLAIGGGVAALACVLLLLLYAAPPRVAAMLPVWIPHQDHSHDLERRGGSYIVLRVDADAAKQALLLQQREDVRAALLTRQILFSHLAADDSGVGVRITDPGQADTAYQALAELTRATPAAPGPAFTLSRQPDQALRLSLIGPNLAEQAVVRDIAIIRRRAEAMGVAWPQVTRQGADRIIVKAPLAADPAKLAAFITRSANLTFQMVDDLSPERKALGAPPEDELLPDDQYGQTAVRRRVVVSGEMLSDAVPSFDQNGRPALSFRFNSAGAQRFAQVTSANVGKRFAIIIDHHIVSAPIILDPITGGSGEITGSFTQREVSELAMLLRAGPLPAPLTVVEQRRVP